jgi:hypothetical protein
MPPRPGRRNETGPRPKSRSELARIAREALKSQERLRPALVHGPSSRLARGAENDTSLRGHPGTDHTPQAGRSPGHKHPPGHPGTDHTPRSESPPSVPVTTSQVIVVAPSPAPGNAPGRHPPDPVDLLDRPDARLGRRIPRPVRLFPSSWALRDLNPRHLPCKGSALPTELSAPGRPMIQTPHRRSAPRRLPGLLAPNHRACGVCASKRRRRTAHSRWWQKWAAILASC